jgi:folate-binding protein YgfZ
VLNDVFIYPDPSQQTAGGGWLVDIDAKQADRLAKHIKRYRLRSKFEVRLVEVGEIDIWSVWNEKSEWERHSLEGSVSGGLDGAELGCVDSRAPGMGKRLLLRDGKKPEVESEEVGEDSAKVRRYLKGVPEGQDELIREVALPQESNIDYMGGIDYRKGCYVGQELTIRTHHTGVVRKRVLPVMLYDAASETPKSLEYNPAEAEDLAVENIAPETRIGRVDKKGRSAGKWLNGVGNLGLALCRLEIMTGMSVGGEAPLGGWKTDDEFKLEWGVDGTREDEVRVKAFVPSWHLNK